MAKKANWRGLHAGDEVALSFTEGEAVVRLALARVAESRWVTLSTDEEYLVEDLSECRRGSLYRLGPRGGLPAVYRNECPSGTFDREWLRDNRDQALREGERLARRQRKKDAKDEPEQEDEESEEESSEEEDDDESDGEEEEEEPPAKAKKKGKAAKAGKKAQSAAAAVPKSRPRSLAASGPAGLRWRSVAACRRGMPCRAQQWSNPTSTIGRWLKLAARTSRLARRALWRRWWPLRLLWWTCAFWT